MCHQQKGKAVARGEKTKYSPKQKRQAHHIEEGYEERGIPEDEAERRAWATVNKVYGGGAEGGSGSEEEITTAPYHNGGKLGGRASASRPKSARSRSAKKAAATRKRRRK